MFPQRFVCKWCQHDARGINVVPVNPKNLRICIQLLLFHDFATYLKGSLKEYVPPAEIHLFRTIVTKPTTLEQVQAVAGMFGATRGQSLI